MKIEKEIPVPAARRGRGRTLSDMALTLIAMEPGESFFMETADKLEQRKRYNTVFKMARRHNVPIEGRYYAEGVRIWKK
jgi:hypothetical protein